MRPPPPPPVMLCDLWQEKGGIIGSSLLSVMDRLALEIIPEDATFMTDNISKFQAHAYARFVSSACHDL